LFYIVIDCENGVPFFTPLYVRVPKFLLIHHIHQDVFRSQLKFPLSHIGLFIESVLMPFFYKNQKIITVSESTRKETKKLGFSDRKMIDVINPGIDTTYLKKSPKTKHPSISYIGRLKPYKNIDVALRAFTRVLADYPTATFSIAGEGESFDELKQLAHQLEIHKNVEFLGKISEKRKAEILGKSWVVVQPSMIEGWGITVIEANACGTPVVASKVSGLQDSVVDRQTGLLIPAGDIKALATSIETIFEDKAFRKQLSTNAFEWSKNFSWNQSAEKFLQIVKRETLHSYEPAHTKNSSQYAIIPQEAFEE
jgi:glycosyltransferase involved in cell wall biosynthesis